MLHGIIPVVTTPFDSLGQVDEEGLRRVVRFELDGGVHGMGVNGFASEAYKMTDAERLRCAEIVADEIKGRIPLIIGIAPNSTEAAIEQARLYASLHPEALMTLPPNTMNNDEVSLIDHYITLGNSAAAPIMIQQSPQIQAYAHCQLSTEGLAQINRLAPNVRYFKIEGPGSSKRIHTLKQRVGEDVKLFGGAGGIALREELTAGAAGLLPGVGFNEFFLKAWDAWEANDHEKVDMILSEAQPLVEAVSAYGHEFSLHARKYLLARAGIISNVTVRRPTVRPDTYVLENIGRMVDDMKLRIARRP
jgi:dihydrodipicolinate synthase/N-acetylneuraminate lyase